jgi:hypothetical protein
MSDKDLGVTGQTAPPTPLTYEQEVHALLGAAEANTKSLLQYLEAQAKQESGDAKRLTKKCIDWKSNDLRRIRALTTQALEKREAAAQPLTPPPCKACETGDTEWLHHDDGCAADKVVGVEQARWQLAVYKLLCKHVPAPGDIDGGGCDSGDPLDFTLTEIKQAICQVQNPADYKAQAAPPSLTAPPRLGLTDAQQEFGHDLLQAAGCIIGSYIDDPYGSDRYQCHLQAAARIIRQYVKDTAAASLTAEELAPRAILSNGWYAPPWDEPQTAIAGRWEHYKQPSLTAAELAQLLVDEHSYDAEFAPILAKDICSLPGIKVVRG